MCVCPYVNYPSFLSYLNVTWTLWMDFRKILKYQLSWKCLSWEPSRCMRTDLWINKEWNGQTQLNSNMADVFSTTVYGSRDKCSTAVLIIWFLFIHGERPNDRWRIQFEEWLVEYFCISLNIDTEVVCFSFILYLTSY
jgi:hypothetical protein